MKKIVFTFIFLMSLVAMCADKFYPEEGWKDSLDIYASQRAKRGGKIALWAGATPKSLNSLLDNNSFSSRVFGLMFESLLETDGTTGEYVPGIASRWSISEDGKVFTFYIDENAKWSDGTTITAEDVLWTFTSIMDPKNMTGVYKLALNCFTEIQPVLLKEENAIRFTSNELHWRNLGSIGGFPIMPKHVYEKYDFNQIKFEFPVVSGPYVLDEFKENQKLIMKRRNDWWAGSKLSKLNTYNFDAIEYRFIGDRENAWEAFRKGVFDFYPIYTARIWAEEIKGDKIERNLIVAKSVTNNKPIGFQGFAMNMRRVPYNDRRVRLALAYMLDRETMNRTMMYGQYFMHKSYFEDLYDENHLCENIEFSFNMEKAKELLKDAGWAPNAETGILSKDGKEFIVKFLTNDSGTSDKFLVKYRSDLRNIGIKLEIERKDWSAWSRDMDAHNYDMTWCAWGAGLFKDPEGMWSSKEADTVGGNNITGFKNEEVDRLIELQRSEYDVKKRNDICRKIDKIVTDNVPYILLWNTSSTRMLWWNKFGMPQSILSKYGSDGDVIVYWWYDEDSVSSLKSALNDKSKVLAVPFVVED